MYPGHDTQTLNSSSNGKMRFVKGSVKILGLMFLFVVSVISVTVLNRTLVHSH